MAREIPVPITPSVLKWAMDEAGYEPVSLAAELSLDADLVDRWLDGREKPSLGKFRQFASLLRRPTATFLLPAPPGEPRPAVAFRHAPGELDRELLPIEHRRIREVTRLQRIASWLVDQLREKVSPLPQTTTSADPENVGKQIRAILDISIGMQLSWKGEGAALQAWRSALERIGVLVFLLPLGKESARGFSLFSDSAPAIAVNTAWNTTARIFTMLHELGHLVTRTNSICAEVGAGSSGTPDGGLERWCEKTAAAALMPRDSIAGALSGWGNPDPSIQTASKVAVAFRVSLRAAALRMVSLGHADWGLYAAVKAATDGKGTARGGTGRTRPKIRIDEYGRRTTRLVLEGIDREIIGPAEAMGFLDVSYRNLDQLREMI